MLQSLPPNISRTDFTIMVCQTVLMLYRANVLDLDQIQKFIAAEFPKQMERAKRRRMRKPKRPRKRTVSLKYGSDDLLTPDKAADVLNLSVKTLANMRSSGGGPLFVKLANRTIRYRYCDLKTFIANGVKQNTSQY